MRGPVKTTEDTTTLHSRWGRGLAVIVWLFCLGVPVTLVYEQHYLGLLRYGGVVLLAAFFGWLLFWAPFVRIAPSGVTVRNLIRTHDVSWPAIQLVDTKYALTLTTTAGKIQAWSAPAPTRWSTFRTAEPELRGLPRSTYGMGNSIRPGDIPKSDSGLAALYVRRFWEQLKIDGYLDDAKVEGSGVVTHWLRPEIIATIVLVALTIAGLQLIRY
jgi:hypothetical protein